MELVTTSSIFLAISQDQKLKVIKKISNFQRLALKQSRSVYVWCMGRAHKIILLYCENNMVWPCSFNCCTGLSLQDTYYVM